MTVRPVDIIVPVHRDVAAARRCLERVLACRNTAPYQLIAVTSASVGRGAAALLGMRDPRVAIHDGGSADYAGLLNRAFALHGDRDVVVLQADAEVHGDWLDRLLAHGGEQGVGIAGTFTNAAGCACYAGASRDDVLPGSGTPEMIDALFARVNRGRSAVMAGIYGPCVYIARSCVASVGGMNAVGGADGRESEIDFSLRARDGGFETRIAADLFVGNDGEGSFGGRTAALETHAATTLARLHPGAPDMMPEAPGSVPLALFTGRVDVARLAESPRPVLVFVSHAWGGGIRRYMDDLTSLIRARADVLYIEPADADTIKLHWPHAPERFAAWFRLPEDLSVLAQTLRAIGVARLHFHHVHGLPQAILDLPAKSGIPYDCTLHDYYAICPQYHLADKNGRYCGEPDEAGCAACIGGRPAHWSLDIRAWRQLLGGFLRRADRVIAPSNDVASRIGRQLPGLAIDVWPHPEVPPPSPPRVVRVVTLGNLSREKGLDVVARCADDAHRRRLPLTFRVLGSTTEPIAQSPDVPLTLHGSYDEGALPQLLVSEHADVLFFPAQVPETYSYTLSVALATAIPIVASSLGAFTERLAERPATRLLPWDATADAWNAALLDAAAASREPRATASAGADVPLGATS